MFGAIANLTGQIFLLGLSVYGAVYSTGGVKSAAQRFVDAWGSDDVSEAARRAVGN